MFAARRGLTNFVCMRRMYVERNKVDGSMYNSEGPEIPEGWPVLPEDFVIPPSGIKYCDGHWIFYNENIRKSKNSRHEDADCPWLARSEEYDGFDLLEVGRNWELWTVSLLVWEGIPRLGLCLWV